MTLTTYANGRTVQNSSAADAFADLLMEFPEMMIYNDGQRTLIWADEASAEDDDGKNAVAQITVVP